MTLKDKLTEMNQMALEDLVENEDGTYTNHGGMPCAELVILLNTPDPANPKGAKDVPSDFARTVMMGSVDNNGNPTSEFGALQIAAKTDPIAANVYAAVEYQQVISTSNPRIAAIVTKQLESLVASNVLSQRTVNFLLSLAQRDTSWAESVWDEKRPITARDIGLARGAS